MSISNYGEGKLLEAVPNEPYVKLHTGDPGEDCTANAAAETTRKKITLGAPSEGTRKSTTEAKWESVSTTEKYKYISLWSAATEGNPYWSMALEAEKSMEAGDTFVMPAEDISISLD